MKILEGREKGLSDLKKLKREKRENFVRCFIELAFSFGKERKDKGKMIVE